MSALPSFHVHRSAATGLLQVSAAGVLWGTGGVAVHLVRDHVALSAGVITGYRTVLGALVLLVVLHVTGSGRSAITLLRRGPVRVVGVALTTLAYQALYYVAVVQAGVSVATVVTLGLAPLLLTCHEAWADRRLPGAGRLVVLAAALAGLVLVARASGSGGAGPEPLLGLLSAAGSAAAYAVATVRGRALAQGTEPLALAAVTTAIGALAMLPVLTLLAGTGVPVVTTDPAALALLTYLGVITMALATCLVFSGLRVVAGSTATLATLLEPVTAAAIAAVLLGERRGPQGWFGMLLVLAALAGLSKRPSP